MSQVTLNDLLGKEKKVDMILHEMENEEYSVLKILGADQIAAETKRKTFISRKLLKKIAREMDEFGLYRKNIGCNILLKALRHYLSVEFHHDRPKLSNSETNIFVMENPTFGEIIRMVGIILSRYQSDIFLPIDLNWYENFLPFLEALTIIGIHPMPFISESLKERILRNGDSPSRDDINLLSEKFLSHCLQYYKNIVFSKTMIILPFETGVFSDYMSRRKREMLTDFMIAIPEKTDSKYCSFVPIHVENCRGFNSDFDTFCVEKFYRGEKLCLTNPEQTVFNGCGIYSELLSRIDFERLRIKSKK